MASVFDPLCLCFHSEVEFVTQVNEKQRGQSNDKELSREEDIAVEYRVKMIEWLSKDGTFRKPLSSKLALFRRGILGRRNMHRD